MRCFMFAAAMTVALAPIAVAAETPREVLIGAAFRTTDRKAALAAVERAIALSSAILARQPDDREARLQQGIGIGYRATLVHSRADAQASRRIFEALAAADPRNPELQLVIAGWHLDAIEHLGTFMARTMLGARAQVGLSALDRAVALGGDRACFAGLAAMMRIRYDRGDIALSRTLAETAAADTAPAMLDQIAKRGSGAILPALRANNGKAAADLSRRLLPFGRLAD